MRAIHIVKALVGLVLLPFVAVGVLIADYIEHLHEQERH